MISASILSIKENIKQNVKLLDETTVDFLHLDIMDGKFVKNKTWDIEQIKDIVENTKKPKDIHLMVDDVKDYVCKFKILNPTYITFHIEVKQDIMELIKYIKNLGIKVGISIKPNTNIEKILPYLPFIDLVLIMTVEPGYGGQKFIEDVIPKVEKLNELKNKFNFILEVDGGINNETISKVKSDIYVVGSYIINSDNYQKQIDKLKIM